MKKTVLFVIVAFILLSVISCGKSSPAAPGNGTATAVKSATPAATFTVTLQGTSTATSQSTLTVSATLTAEPSNTLTMTPVYTASETNTAEDTATFTQTPTATRTPFIILGGLTIGSDTGLSTTYDAAGQPLLTYLNADVSIRKSLGGVYNSATITVDCLDDSMPAIKLLPSTRVDCISEILGTCLAYETYCMYSASVQSCASCAADVSAGSSVSVEIDLESTTYTMTGTVPSISRSTDGKQIFMPDSGAQYSVRDSYYGGYQAGSCPYTYNVNPARPSCTDLITGRTMVDIAVTGIDTGWLYNELKYSLPTFTQTATVTCTPTFTATPTNTPMSASFREGVNLYAACEDAWLNSGSQTFNNGNCATLSAAMNGTTLGRMLIKFGLNTLSGSTVMSATLTLKVSSMTGSGTLEAFRLARAFTEGAKCNAASTTEATWVRAAGTTLWTNPGGDYTTSLGSASFSAGTTDLVINLDPVVVQAWINNSAANYGMLLKIKETSNNGVSVYSLDHATVTNRPQLQVYYY